MTQNHATMLKKKRGSSNKEGSIYGKINDVTRINVVVVVLKTKEKCNI